MKITYQLLLTFLTLFIQLSFGSNISAPKFSHLEEEIKIFLVDQICKQHKTVEPSSIEIKILNFNNIANKTCNQKINYHLPVYSDLHKKTTITAECQDQRPWKIYIPVKVKFLANVLSVKTSLPKMHIIDPKDLVQKKINVVNLKSNYFADSNEVIGLMLKNSVKQDTILTSNLLEKVEHGA